MTTETNAEFLARVGDPIEGVTEATELVAALREHFYKLHDAMFATRARRDYPDALDRLRAAEAEIARLKARPRDEWEDWNDRMSSPMTI